MQKAGSLWGGNLWGNLQSDNQGQLVSEVFPFLHPHAHYETSGDGISMNHCFWVCRVSVM